MTTIRTSGKRKPWGTVRRNCLNALGIHWNVDTLSWTSQSAIPVKPRVLGSQGYKVAPFAKAQKRSTTEAAKLAECSQVTRSLGEKKSSLVRHIVECSRFRWRKAMPLGRPVLPDV